MRISTSSCDDKTTQTEPNNLSISRWTSQNVAPPRPHERSLDLFNTSSAPQRCSSTLLRSPLSVQLVMFLQSPAFWTFPDTTGLDQSSEGHGASAASPRCQRRWGEVQFCQSQTSAALHTKRGLGIGTATHCMFFSPSPSHRLSLFNLKYIQHDNSIRAIFRTECI